MKFADKPLAEACTQFGPDGRQPPKWPTTLLAIGAKANELVALVAHCGAHDK